MQKYPCTHLVGLSPLVTSFCVVLLFMITGSVSYADQQEVVGVSITISNTYTTTFELVGPSYTSGSDTYVTNGQLTLRMGASAGANYAVYGDYFATITGANGVSFEEFRTISLNSPEGVTQIHAQFVRGTEPSMLAPMDIIVDLSGPTRPAVIEPLMSSVFVDTPITFSWADSIDTGAGLAGYTIYISTQPDLSNAYSTFTTDTTITLQNIGLPEGVWYRYVEAEDRLGQTTPGFVGFIEYVDTTNNTDYTGDRPWTSSNTTSSSSSNSSNSGNPPSKKPSPQGTGNNEEHLSSDTKEIVVGIKRYRRSDSPLPAFSLYKNFINDRNRQIEVIKSIKSKLTTNPSHSAADISPDTHDQLRDGEDDTGVTFDLPTILQKTGGDIPPEMIPYYLDLLHYAPEHLKSDYLYLILGRVHARRTIYLFFITLLFVYDIESITRRQKTKTKKKYIKTGQNGF